MSIKQALIVGIDNYTTADALNYATHDAKEFASALGMQEYGFDSDLLLDSAATTSKLMTSISTLMRSSSRTKLFYFAGHGCANENGVYLVTTDDSYDEPGISLVSFPDRFVDTVKLPLTLDSRLRGWE